MGPLTSRRWKFVISTVKKTAQVRMDHRLSRVEGISSGSPSLIPMSEPLVKASKLKLLLYVWSAEASIGSISDTMSVPYALSHPLCDSLHNSLFDSQEKLYTNKKHVQIFTTDFVRQNYHTKLFGCKKFHIIFSNKGKKKELILWKNKVKLMDEASTYMGRKLQYEQPM